MLEMLFANIVEITASVSILILLLLALTPLLRRRYAAKWRYWVWFALAARLLIPLNISLPKAPVQVQIPNRTVLSVPAADTAAQISAVPPAAGGEPVQISQAAASTPVTIMQLAAMIWLAGAVLFLLWQAASYLYFARQVRRWSRPAKDSRVLELAEQLQRETGLRKPMPVLICPKAPGPMVMGLFSPRLLLVSETYETRALYFILKHEMVHVRRGDIWYKMLLLLANALHWFNPLVWWMSHQAGRDVEIACDDEVIRGMDRESRGYYGSTILEVVRKRHSAPAFSTYFSGSGRSVKERLRNLFDRRNKRKGVLALCLVVLLAGAVGIFAACTASSPSSLPDGQDQSAPSMEVDLGEMGRVTFEIPAVFDGRLEALVETSEEVTTVQLWLKDVPAEEQLYTLCLMTEKALAQMEADGMPLPVELLRQDGYLIGGRIVPYNPLEDFAEEYPDEYALVQEHHSELWQSIQNTIAWVPLTKEPQDTEEKEQILAALQQIIRQYQAGTVENNALEPRFEDFPADARYPQLTSIEDFTVEEGNEMFGRMVRLSAGSYDMICALDYFADPGNGESAGWAVSAVRFESNGTSSEDTPLLYEYLPFSDQQVGTVVVERYSGTQVEAASLSGEAAQDLCRSLSMVPVTGVEDPDPAAGSKRVYQFTLLDGTVYTIEEMKDIMLNGRLICRLGDAAYPEGYPEPWQYSNPTWTRYEVDPVTGVRTAPEQETPPDFYAEAYLDFEMEGVFGQRYAEEGDWEKVEQVLQGFTMDNLQSLVLTSSPSDQTQQVEMDQSQVEEALEIIQALQGEPWPYDPNDQPNPPTGGACGAQLVRDDGVTVQFFFNGAWLTVTMTGEEQSIVFDCESPEANSRAYAIDELFWKILNPGQ